MSHGKDKKKCGCERKKECECKFSPIKGVNFTLSGDLLTVTGKVNLKHLEEECDHLVLIIPFCQLGLTSAVVLDTDRAETVSNLGCVRVKADLKCEILKLSFKNKKCVKKVTFTVKIPILAGFESISKVEDVTPTIRPPDPNMAAGPKELVAAVNRNILIYRKQQAGLPQEVFRTSFYELFGLTIAGNGVADPWILYDQYVNRFILIVVYTIRNPDPTKIRFLIGFALSKSSTFSTIPTNDDWFIFSVDLTNQGNIPDSVIIPDYPKLGYDKDFYYVCTNDFDLLVGNFFGVGVFAVEKASVLCGGQPVIPFNVLIPFNDPQFAFPVFSLFPVQNYDPKTRVMHFIMANEFLAFSDSSNQVEVVSIPSGIWQPLVQTVIVNTYTQNSITNGVPQPDPAAGTLDVIGIRFMSGLIRNNRLWASHTTLRLAENRYVVRWYKFQVDVKDVNFPVSVIQQGDVDDTPLPTDNTWMSHIQVDKCGSMGVAFSIGGTQRFASIGYSGRLADDPPGTTRPVQIVRNGEDSYAILGDVPYNPDISSWGDYTGLALDPCDEKTFWLFNEYPKATPDLGSPTEVWKTFGAAFTIGCCDQELSCTFKHRPSKEVLAIKRGPASPGTPLQNKDAYQAGLTRILERFKNSRYNKNK